MHLTFVATLLVSLGGALAWREWRAWGTTPPRDQGGREGRSRFLAALGLLCAPIFALTIVALWSAAFYYDPCQ